MANRNSETPNGCFPHPPLVVPLTLHSGKGGGVISSFLGYPYNSARQGYILSVLFSLNFTKDQWLPLSQFLPLK